MSRSATPHGPRQRRRLATETTPQPKKSAAAIIKEGIIRQTLGAIKGDPFDAKQPKSKESPKKKDKGKNTGKKVEASEK
tara:strand:+ start:408 stop:644 length:237 start_codon:yes stop_codon:yes gene_type:complete